MMKAHKWSDRQYLTIVTGEKRDKGEKITGI